MTPPDVYIAIGLWAIALAGIIALLIGLIALRGYSIFKSWRFLLLALAFFSLAFPSLTVCANLIFGNGDFYRYGLFLDGDPFFPLALILLTIVYMEERSKASITITRGQWLAVGLLIVPELFFLTLVAYSSLMTSIGNNGYTGFYSDGISYILVLLTLTSLFASYKAKKNTNTLLTMGGFVCILFSQIPLSVTAFVYIILVRSFSSSAFYFITGILAFLGYLTFLIAIVRARASHG